MLVKKLPVLQHCQLVKQQECNLHVHGTRADMSQDRCANPHRHVSQDRHVNPHQHHNIIIVLTHNRLTNYMTYQTLSLSTKTTNWLTRQMYNLRFTHLPMWMDHYFQKLLVCFIHKLSFRIAYDHYMRKTASLKRLWMSHNHFLLLVYKKD